MSRTGHGEDYLPSDVDARGEGRPDSSLPPPGADRTAIHVALAGAVAARRFDAPELRAAVAQFARRSRGRGVPPEQLVIQLKAIVREDTLAMGDWWRVVLTDRFVRWGVEAYYRLDPADRQAD